MFHPRISYPFAPSPYARARCPAIPGTFWFTPNTMIHQFGAGMIDEAAGRW